MPLTYSNLPSSSCASHAQSSEELLFNAQETYKTITCKGTTVTPTLDAQVENGFSYSGNSSWICYRRNYIAVTVSYSLSPWIQDSPLYLAQDDKQPEQIQSMAVFLAATDSDEKSVELIQYTSRRKDGPQLSMDKKPLAPTPPCYNQEVYEYGLDHIHLHLPLQEESNCSQQYSSTSQGSRNYQHHFERIQFKSSTRHNGSHTAQQQYYYLVVELWANTQNLRDNEPKWVKVAARSSQPMIVRGRSPRHYQHKGSHNAGTSRDAGDPGLSGSGRYGLGSNGAQAFGLYSNDALHGSATMGGNLNLDATNSFNLKRISSHPVSSASSLSGGLQGSFAGYPHMVYSDDTNMNNASQGYHPYHLAPHNENIPADIENLLLLQ